MGLQFGMEAEGGEQEDLVPKRFSDFSSIAQCRNGFVSAVIGTFSLGLFNSPSLEESAFCCLVPFLEGIEEC